MSTRRTRRQGKNKYIKIQDSENSIYETDDDSSIEIFPERDRGQAEKYFQTSEEKGEALETEGGDCLNLSKQADPDSASETAESEKAELDKYGEYQEVAAGETEDLTASGRKRNPLPQSTSIAVTKKIKTEPTKKMSDVPEQKPLEIEFQLERNRVPFKRRNINTIIDELDTITRRLKEGYEKCDQPMYWGTPIVKQSSEKWDPNHIPEKLLEMYEKDLAEPCSSSSLSEGASESRNLFKSSEAKTIRSGPEGVDEEGFEAAEYDTVNPMSSEDMFDPNAQGKMNLRSRNVSRSNYDERSSSDFDRHSKKSSSKSGREKKPSHSKKRAMPDLEVSQDSHSQYFDDDCSESNPSFDKLKIDNGGPSVSSVKSHTEEKVISLPYLPSRVVEEEQVACPICGKNFEKKRIESHATHCATETFRD